MSDPNQPQGVVILGSGASNLRTLTGEQGDAVIKHPVKAPATIVGPKGRAWRCDLAAGRARLGVLPENDGTLVHWIVEAPWAHPVWHSYSIFLVHLRPMPDKRRTSFYLDDATHEIVVFACNPELPLDDVVATGIVRGQEWLHPKNYASQIIEVEDRFALERVERAVGEIIEGKLSPDTDHTRCCWAPRFGDCMLKDRANPRPPTVRYG